MKKLGTFLQTLLFLSLGLFIMWRSYKSQSEEYAAGCIQEGLPAEECNYMSKILSDLAQMDKFWILIVLVVYIISNISRTSRWMMLLNSLGYRPRWLNAFWTIMLGYFANLGLPRAGEVVRAASLSKYENLPTHKVMGTVVLDRMMDLLSFGIIFCLGLLFSFDLIVGYIAQSASIPMSKIFILFAFLLAGLGSLFILFRSQRLGQFILVRKIKNLIRGIGEGIATIRKLSHPWLFVFHSVVIWLMYFLMAYFMFLAYDKTAELGLVAALVTFIFGALGMIAPVQGGIGAYQFMVATALTLYGIDRVDGWSFANIMFFAVNILVNVLLGLISLVFLPIYNASFRTKNASPYTVSSK